jgi:hypothetical protein
LHYLSKVNATKEDLEQTFRFGGAYPFVGLITKAGNDLRLKMTLNNVNERDIKYLVNNLTYLFIGAYDEEGYLIVELK